jgi:DNA-binding NtrC family response regulator
MATTHLLLVDDEPQFLDSLHQRLAQRGYTVQAAATGREALRKVKAPQAFDVVVLDIGMPYPDGIRTLECIKKEHPLLQVIMLSGNESIRAAVASIKAGAYDYLSKPCHLEELITKIEEAAANKRQREAEILDVRMIPYISDQRRTELIAAILQRGQNFRL